VLHPFAVAGPGFLAEDLPPRLTPIGALTRWTFDPWLALGVLLVAGLCLYLAGVRVLHGRGDAWPALRTASFVGLGLGTVVVATMSSLGTYDDVLFSVHMIQHMLLAMVAPVFLALGAPVTLALRTLPGRPRHLLQRLLKSRFARVVSSPPVTWPLFVGTPFVLYFTGLYELSLRNNAFHELVHVHFLLTGCLFFWPLIGLDPVPGRMPYLLRLILVFLALPAHAFLGIAIMSDTSVLAGDFYRGLGRSWGGSLLTDQHLGGGILWASGDLVGLLFMTVLAVQWVNAEERVARREDRRLDRLEARAAATAAAAEAEARAEAEEPARPAGPPPVPGHIRSL
jgi:cytochrome c oxidase assembly factor CtaG